MCGTCLMQPRCLNYECMKMYDLSDPQRLTLEYSDTKFTHTDLNMTIMLQQLVLFGQLRH